MSFDNLILCKVCNGRDFEPANGAFYCQSCSTECREHGQDFVYEEANTSLAEPSELGEDTDSNDENHCKNDYPDEDLFHSDSEESAGDEDELLSLENFKGDIVQKKFDLETDEESQEEQAGS